LILCLLFPLFQQNHILFCGGIKASLLHSHIREMVMITRVNSIMEGGIILSNKQVRKRNLKRNILIVRECMFITFFIGIIPNHEYIHHDLYKVGGKIIGGGAGNEERKLRLQCSSHLFLPSIFSHRVFRLADDHRIKACICSISLSNHF